MLTALALFVSQDTALRAQTRLPTAGPGSLGLRAPRPLAEHEVVRVGLTPAPEALPVGGGRRASAVALPQTPSPHISDGTPSGASRGSSRAPALADRGLGVAPRLPLGRSPALAGPEGTARAQRPRAFRARPLGFPLPPSRDPVGRCASPSLGAVAPADGPGRPFRVCPARAPPWGFCGGELRTGASQSRLLASLESPYE